MAARLAALAAELEKAVGDEVRVQSILGDLTHTWKLTVDELERILDEHSPTHPPEESPA